VPDFDLGLQIWTLLTFLGLLALLAKFAFKPLKKILADRENFLRDMLDQSRKSNEEAARLLEENRRQMLEARETARRAMEEGRNSADEIMRKAHEQTRVQANAMIEQARNDIDREVLKGIDQLKSTVADVSLQVARQVIKENLDERHHAVLVDEFIDQLKKNREQPAIHE
jgi:F-type H+-transporting ATPase subunit b